MLEPCLLQPCFNVAPSRAANPPLAGEPFLAPLVYIHTYIYIYIYIHIDTYLSISLYYVYIYIYICMYMYMYTAWTKLQLPVLFSTPLRHRCCGFCRCLVGLRNARAGEAFALRETPLWTTIIRTKENIYLTELTQKVEYEYGNRGFGDGLVRPPHWDSRFRGVSLKRNLDFEGWSSHVHRVFPWNLESTNLSRDNLSREIGRSHGQIHRRYFCDFWAAQVRA